MAAQGLVVLQLIFGAGMVTIGAGALIILMNGIVIAVLERRGEIGTMRALGATKQFVRRLFAVETLAIVTAASLAGLALGAMASLLVSREGIVLANSALISLFGGTILRPRLGVVSVLAHFAGALAAGSLAWVYPVRLALRIQPLAAMSGK
jgi:putative ABC transport system permease protein